MKHGVVLLLFCLIPGLCHAQYSALNGDLNHDGMITVADVVLMQEIMLGRKQTERVRAKSELSFDDHVEIARLMTGADVNVAIKQLVDPAADRYQAVDRVVKKISFCKGATTKGSVVSDPNSEHQVRAVYNAPTQEVRLYVDADALEFPVDANCLFCSFESLVSIDWGPLAGSILTDKVTGMNSMFYGCKSLASIDLSVLNTSKVRNMGYMFYDCEALPSLDLSHFDTSTAVDMGGLFYNCFSLVSIDVSMFDTKNAMFFDAMFEGCSSLQSLDLSGFDTKNVIVMDRMFQGCTAMSELNLGAQFTISSRCSKRNMCAGLGTITSMSITCTDEIKNRLSESDAAMGPVSFRLIAGE